MSFSLYICKSTCLLLKVQVIEFMVREENSNKHFQNPWIRKASFFQELLNYQKAIEDIFLNIIPAINTFTTMNLAEHFFSFRHQIIHVDLSQYLQQNMMLLQCCDTVYPYYNGLVCVATFGYFLSKLLFSIWCHLSLGYHAVLGMVAQVGPRFCSTSLIKALQCFLHTCMWCCSCSSLLLKDAFEIPHANKPKPKDPQHLIHSYSSMFLGFFSLCFFLSPSLCASHVFRKHEAKTILSRILKSSYNFNLSSSCPGSSFPLK